MCTVPYVSFMIKGDVLISCWVMVIVLRKSISVAGIVHGVLLIKGGVLVFG